MKRSILIQMVILAFAILLPGLKAQQQEGQDLLAAVSRGDFYGVESLLGKGPDINAKDSKGRTPLMVATAQGRALEVKLRNGEVLRGKINGSIVQRVGGMRQAKYIVTWPDKIDELGVHSRNFQLFDASSSKLLRDEDVVTSKCSGLTFGSSSSGLSYTCMNIEAPEGSAAAVSFGLAPLYGQYGEYGEHSGRVRRELFLVTDVRAISIPVAWITGWIPDSQASNLNVGVNTESTAALLKARTESPSLASIGIDRNDVEALARALGHESPTVRADASLALARLGVAAVQSVPRLKGMLRDPEPALRVAAIEALMAVDAVSAIEMLSETLKLLDQVTRLEALERLGDLGASAQTAVPNIIECLRDADGTVRQQAMMTIKTIGPAASAAVPQLIEALQEKTVRLTGRAAYEEEMVAYGALDALSAMSGKGLPAIPAILKFVKRDHSSGPFGYTGSKSKQALASIAKGAPKESLPLLTAGLADPGVAPAAARVLGELGRGAAPSLPAILQALRDDRGEDGGNFREDVVKAIQNIGISGEHVPQLIDVLQNGGDSARRFALSLLGSLGTSARPALEAIRSASKDKDKAVREAAKNALKQIK